MKRKTRRAVILTTIAAALFLCGALSAAAQHGYRVEKRIAFKRGEVAATVKGTIPNTLEGHEYIFRGRKGQTLMVILTSAKKDIGFSIMTPAGEMLDEETALRKWSGELPSTGDYHLIINTSLKGAARYTLKIQIASDI
jgi:hypothetical protein